MNRRIVVFGVLALLLALGGIPARAATVTSTNLGIIGCLRDVPLLLLDVNGGFVAEDDSGVDRVYVALYDGNNTMLTLAFPVAWGVGQSGMQQFDIGPGGRISLVNNPAKNPIRAVVFEGERASYVTEARFDSPCLDPNPTYTDGRLQLGTGVTLLYTRLNADAPAWGTQGPGMALFGVDSQGVGFEIISFSAQQLARLPLRPRSDRLLASPARASHDGPVLFYKTSDGNYLVVTGPNVEGFVRTITLVGFPPRELRFGGNRPAPER